MTPPTEAPTAALLADPPAASALGGAELAAATARQREVWAGGDFHAVAATIVVVSERLADAADLRAGSRVLDVACGSGNAALAAARCGCDAVGVDFVPHLLERGRLRAAAEGLPVEFVEGDAQALPFPEASFDAVVSVFGSMFAPDQERAARELLRVCRPGGRIALASWTPDGFVGEMLRTVARRVPPCPGLRPPTAWGTEERLSELLGGSARPLAARRRTYTFRARSADEFVAFFRRWYGPTVAAFAALDGEGRTRLAADLTDLALRWNRLEPGGPVAIPGSYFETVAERASL